MNTIKFNNANSLFSKTLKNNTNNYFLNSKKKKTGNFALYLKASILIIALVSIYFTLLFANLHWSIDVLLCIILGFNLAAIGFNIMHDAGHNSFTTNKNVNNVLSYSLNLLGGNIYLWKLKHNISHHTYTNIDGEDHDIEIKFMRIHHDQKLKKHHKYQKYYFPLLYSISYLAWIFFQDYEKYFKQTMGTKTEEFNFPRKEKVIFWISKAIHFTLFVIIPIYVLGFVPTILGILIISIVCGFTLATVFQLAHVVENTEFKTIEDLQVQEEWMIHQIQSTSNFATKNKIVTWLLGGLNFQVEHHLFPKVSHVHYPALNKIVKETCLEFNLQYNEYQTTFQAFRAHINVINSLSR